MAHHPLVSFGMPVYNGAPTIGRAIESLLAQTYPYFEVVICDNCSSDRTADICARYRERDERVRYYRNSTNIGLTRNFLWALQLARGEFFTWACADDVRPADAIEALMHSLGGMPAAVMAHGPVVSIQGGDHVVFPNAMDLGSLVPADRVWAFTGGVKHNSMCYGLYKRSALTKIIFGDHYGADYLMCLQMCLLGPVAYTTTPMIFYHEKVRTHDPMGRETPLTVRHALTVSKRVRKSWVVLGRGCMYLGRCDEISLQGRIKAVRAFVFAFVARYHRRLIRDVVLILLTPLSYPVCLSWNIARRFPPALRLSQSVKTRLKQG